MGKNRNRKQARREVGVQSNTSTSASDGSLLDSSLQGAAGDSKRGEEVSHLIVSTPTSVKETLKTFRFVSREERNGVKDMGDSNGKTNTASSVERVVSLEQNSSVSNEDLMQKLNSVLDKVSANGDKISRLTDRVEELTGKVFQLEQDNEHLRRELSETIEREKALKDLLEQSYSLAEVAERKSEDRAAYVRRNNLRFFGLVEASTGDREETQEECEAKVLEMCNQKLKVKVVKEDFEACHRLGKKNKDGSGAPRGVIARFVSRRIRDKVILARRNLKGTRIVIAEDLTPKAYALLMAAKDDKDVCQQAWTKNGRVLIKTVSGQIVSIDCLADLKADQNKRQRWSRIPNLKNRLSFGEGSGHSSQPRGGK